MPDRILAIDPGTRMGYARCDAEHVESGVIDWKKRSFDDTWSGRWQVFRSWFDVALSKPGPELVVFEPQMFNIGKARLLQIGYQVHLIDACHRAKVPMMECHISTLKKWATGNGRASKEDMIRAAGAHWPHWHPPHFDDNEADALLLLAWAREGGSR